MPLFSGSNGAKCMSAKWLRPVGDRVTHPISLHSKRFRASSSRKLGQEQKKKGMRGEGEGSEGWKIRIKGRKTLGDKSQRQIASCLQRTFCEIICLATRRKFTNSNWFDFANCGEDKILSKISVHRNSLGQAMWFVAATCLCDLLHRNCINLQQLVARLVQKKWFITATWCSDMSPGVFRH